MALRAVVGARKQASIVVMRYALTRTPSLVIDCANIADFHRWNAVYPDTDYAAVSVIELELLYKFRDAVKALDTLAPNVSTVVVTSAKHLFHYGDESENVEVLTHAWELLAEHALTRDIVAVADTPAQVRCARRVQAQLVTVQEFEESMGHTVASQRTTTEEVISALSRYARTLPQGQQERLRELLRIPLQHAGSISYANSRDAWAFSLLTIIERQELRILRLEDAVARRRVPNEREDCALAQDA